MIREGRDGNENEGLDCVVQGAEVEVLDDADDGG